MKERLAFESRQGDGVCDESACKHESHGALVGDWKYVSSRSTLWALFRCFGEGRGAKC